MKYLIKLTPIEFYFFGDENAFHYDENAKKNNSYYAKSIPIPPQTSIIGMLRYVLLEQSGFLKADGRYNEEEKRKMDDLIGESSYGIEKIETLGKIKEISPLFIVDTEGNKYIKTPLNHKTSEKYYTPIRLADKVVQTSEGLIRLPENQEFNPKKTVGLSYISMSDGLVIENLFETDERVGIDKAKRDEAFVKKLYYKLKEGYSFAVIVELEDGIDLNDTICYMGREKSSFRVDVIKDVEDFEFHKFVNTNGMKFYYALSDLILKEKIEYNGFAMVEVGSLRVLTTKIKNNCLKKTREQQFYNVIKAGSVFYEKPKNDCFYGEQYGLNKLKEIGVK